MDFMFNGMTTLVAESCQSDVECMAEGKEGGYLRVYFFFCHVLICLLTWCRNNPDLQLKLQKFQAPPCEMVDLKKNDRSAIQFKREGDS